MNVGALKNRVIIGVALGCVWAVVGCDTSNEEVLVSSCGGDLVSVDANDFCVYQQTVVVENGFSCPPDFPALTIAGPIGICALSGSLNDTIIARIAREHRSFLPELWKDNCIDNADCQELQVCAEWNCISGNMASNGTSNSTTGNLCADVVCATGSSCDPDTGFCATNSTSNGTTSNGTTGTSNGTTNTSNGTTLPQELGFIEFVSVVPDIIAVRGSGQNETAELTFRVLDVARAPVEGATVRFILNNAPAQTTLFRAEVQSDENGLATTAVQSGIAGGAFSVKAIAIFGDDELETVSPFIPVVGANPTRGGWQLNCEVYNMGGLLERFDNDVAVDNSILCSSLLLDRFQNPIGAPRSVAYKSEGGQIISPQLTVEWPPEQPEPPANVGTVVVPYRPLGDAPCDVAPIDGEPFRNVEGVCVPSSRCPDIGDVCVLNPRDGLVTIIAMTPGEEEFNDFNGNGAYDEGEPFWDLGEPFVDTNDNNTHEEGEVFDDLGTDDDPDGNGLYDGGNNVWDARTVIWVSTRVLLTGNPSESDTHGYVYSDEPMSAYDGSTPLGEVMAGQWGLGVWWHDDNLNRLNASATYSAEFEGNTNGLQLNIVSAPTLEDGFSLGDWDVSYSSFQIEDNINSYNVLVGGWPDLTGYPYGVQIEALGDSYGCTRIEDGCAVNFNVRYSVLPDVGAVREYTIRAPFIVPEP